MADPDLTTRARAVLAGLDDYLIRHGAVFLGASSLPRREVMALAEHGLVQPTSRRTAKLIRFATTDLGREVARLLHALDDARAVLAKCPWCIHPRHAGLCTGRNGGTAHQCPCFQDSLHAPEAIEAARLLAEGGAA